MIGFIIFFIDENLLKSGVDNIVYSLFIMVFEKCGIVFVVSVMNVVILILVLFCGNFGFYVLLRMLYVLVLEGKVFKFL